MKKFNMLIGVALSLTMATLINGCGGGGGDTVATAPVSKTGNVSLSLKDAPIDDKNVTGVWVTFVALRYQYSDNDDNWQDVNLSEAVTINLLDLQNGKTIPLNNIDLPAGEIEHVRFVLDTAPDKCYVTVKAVIDGVETTENHPLTVPSADQTGFKAIGGFAILEGGTVNITADFDLRKSVTLTGTGEYILKPTIKLTDDSETGEIIGTVLDIADETTVVIYAYEDGNFDADEFNASNDDNTTNDFLNAYSSDEVNLTDGSYILSSLIAVSTDDDGDDDHEDDTDNDDINDTDDEDDVNHTDDDDTNDDETEDEDEGTYYDLVVVSSDGGILGYVDNVLVQADETTVQDIIIDTLVKDYTSLTVVTPLLQSSL